MDMEIEHKNILRRHFADAYVSLRLGTAIIAFIFPILLYVSGKLHGIDLQDSMSAYYWAPGNGESPVRVWFIGGLFAIGSFLYLYKGFSNRENIALNLAAIFAIGVAYFPMEWGEVGKKGDFSIHGFSAVAMFVCLTFVAWFCSGDTLKYHRPGTRKRAYKLWYRITGLIMLASPLVAVLLQSILHVEKSKFVFIAELVAIYGFALYWAIKTCELRESNLGFKLDVAEKQNH